MPGSVSGRSRSRWVALGATLTVLLGAGGGFSSEAASPGGSSFVPITPCRLLDTRSAPETVGPRSTPLGPNGTYTADAWGAQGNCVIPNTATGLALNVVIFSPTAPSFLTIWPADQVKPLAASLNWVAGQAPTPNGVLTKLSADGKLSFYNLAGNADLIVDVVGFFEPTSSGGTGPQGPSGPAGAAGTNGTNGTNGAKGDKGDPGTNGTNGATGPAGPVNRISNAQIGALRWFEDPGRAATITGFSNPRGIAFDGSSIWVANRGSVVVTKIDPATGVKTNYQTGPRPLAVAFDGTYLWVTDELQDNVKKVDPATGAVIENYPTGTTPSGVAFDGTNIWVTNFDDGTVTRINRATGATSTFNTGIHPLGVAFDGTSIWVANQGSGTVSKFLLDGMKVNDYPTGSGSSGVAFDGTNIWVTNLSVDSVSKINPATGNEIVEVPTVDGPYGVAFDGTNIWVTSLNQNFVWRMSPSTDDLSAYPTGSGSRAVAFDGTNIWVTHDDGSNTVSKILP